MAGISFMCGGLTVTTMIVDAVMVGRNAAFPTGSRGARHSIVGRA
ncbi:hypothetical protein [Streptomyces sp. NPDC050528]